MAIPDYARLTDTELRAFLHRLFPGGVTGAEVVREIAPEGWERSPLVACFHPSVKQLFAEEVGLHRALESLRQQGRGADVKADEPPRPGPTLKGVRRGYHPQPVQADHELTELMGRCLWDVFSDNHLVVGVDGRAAYLGSVGAASQFLDEHVGGDSRAAGPGHLPRFFPGTSTISRRADVTGVHAMIFRRLRSVDADWVYRATDVVYGLVDLASWRQARESAAGHSLPRAAADDLRKREREKMVTWFRAEFGDELADGIEETINRPPSPTVCAYRHVYGRDPCGWPPF